MEYEYSYEYGYNYPLGSEEAFVTGFLTVYLVIVAVIAIGALASYIFHSVGMYTIGKRMGKSHAWLAFIPFARDYFHGELSGRIDLKKKSIKNPGIWKLILPIIYSVVVGVIVVFFTAAVIGAVAAAEMSHGDLGGFAALMSTLFGLYGAIIILTVAYSAVYLVLSALINIQIFERFTTRNMAVVHAALSMIIPLYEAICFFVLRKRDFNPGMEPKLTPPPVPPVYPGGPTPGGPMPGGPTPGNPTPDGPMPGNPMSGGPTPGNPMPGGPTPGNPMPGGPMPGNPMPGNPAQGGIPAGPDDKIK